jgi:acetate kinase
VGTNVNILTINAGSSSIKLALFSAESSVASFERVLEASITDIGQSTAALHVHEPPEAEPTQQLTVTDQTAAITVLLDWLADKMSRRAISAIGHRIVHGGPKYSQPQIITETLEQELQSMASFDPEHAQVTLHLINALRQRFPDIPQVACFDTAFFHDLPRVAQILPLPRKYEAQGLQRYGFHGLSYTYLLSAFREKAGEASANGRVIFAHLGSGASLAATHGGKPIDTTMSLTPASGLVMSSRSGDLDPGIVWYLHQQTAMSLEDYNHMVNFESGLLGVSGLSADMLTLLQNEAANEKAAEAVNLFCYQAKKSIGALAAALGGLNSLVFSGGIGEQAPVIRERICAGLDFLGIELDETNNKQQAALISSPHSKVGVHLIPTDEALVIAKQAMNIINHDTAQREDGNGLN